MAETKKMTEAQKEAQADPMQERTSQFNHETSTLVEPSREDDPEVRRHQVDPVMDPKLFTEEQVNAPVPRRADPFAHQRDKEGAAATVKQEAKRDAAARKAAGDEK